MISFLCPTRWRPKEFKRMVDSIFATQTNQTEIIAYIDDDDETLNEYPRPNEYLRYIIGPRIILTDCWNKCFAATKADILCQGNDDVIFRTKGWDKMVEDAYKAYPDKILLVHGSDEGQHFSNFGAHAFVHRRWIETVGFFIPPWFVSDFGDAWINEIANALKRRKYLPFIIEHMHPMFKKAQLDRTYADRLSRHRQADPGTLYYSERMRKLREKNIARLAALLNNPLEKPVPKNDVRVCQNCQEAFTVSNKESNKVICIKCEQKDIIPPIPGPAVPEAPESTPRRYGVPTMSKLGMWNEQTKRGEHK